MLARENDVTSGEIVAEQRAIHRLMALGRALDRALAGLSRGQRRHWFTAVGEDGVIVGATHGLADGDVVATHYRGAPIVNLIRGVPLHQVVAACLGTVESYNRGRMRGDVAGSVEHGVIGCYSGSIGPQIAYGTGAAWAMKLQRRANVAVVMFGDGSAHRGEFHESANFAAVKKLPVVYVCQNNQYAIASPLSQQTACRSFADRGIGYGMPGLQVDGNDVLAVRAAAHAAVARARAGAGPTLIDALTYRANGGYGDLPPREQPAAELAAWRARDPLQRLEQRLLREGVLTAEQLAACHAHAAAEVAGAVAAAESGALPQPDELDPELVCAPA